MAQLTVSGKDFDITVFAVTTSDTEITLNAPIKSYILRAREDVNIQLRREENDADYFTIFPGETFASDIDFAYATDSVSIGWLRSESGTVNVEVLGIF